MREFREKVPQINDDISGINVKPIPPLSLDPKAIQRAVNPDELILGLFTEEELNLYNDPKHQDW